ncbi:MAG: DUF6340 family protein [Bacteroidia bacterium]|nr:DUF6340 family protein [Bacteroidia bacterium]
MRFYKLYLILLATMSSCVTQQRINWETGVTEATIELPPETKSVSVLNRVRLAYSFNNTGLNPNLPDFMVACINNFKNQVRRQKFMSVSHTQEKYKKRANGQFPDTLTSNEIKSSGIGSDIIASLEMLDQKINDTYTIDIRLENLGNNIYKEVDYIIGKRTIDVKTGWRLYDVKSGTLIDEWEQNKNYFYEAESLDRARATSLLNNNYKRELYSLGADLGRQYAQRISPTKHLRTRNIYASGNIYLENGARAATQEKWDDAQDIWLEGLEHEVKRKKLAYLYHNLAINEERQGNIEKAREYARLAANQHPLGVKTQSKVGF